MHGLLWRVSKGIKPQAASFLGSLVRCLGASACAWFDEVGEGQRQGTPLQFNEDC